MSKQISTITATKVAKRMQSKYEIRTTTLEVEAISAALNALDNGDEDMILNWDVDLVCKVAGEIDRAKRGSQPSFEGCSVTTHSTPAEVPAGTVGKVIKDDDDAITESGEGAKPLTVEFRVMSAKPGISCYLGFYHYDQVTVV
jgi:hypothetical protein